MSARHRFFETVLIGAVIFFLLWHWFVGLDFGKLTASLPKTVALADGTGWTLFPLPPRLTILDFGASWCPPCRWEEPIIAGFSRSNPSVRLKFVDEQESPPVASAFAKEFGLSTPVLDEGALASALSVSKYPTVIVVRPDGSVAATFVGYNPAIGVALLRFAR